MRTKLATLCTLINLSVFLVLFGNTRIVFGQDASDSSAERIIFSSQATRQWQVYSMNTDGSDVQLVTPAGFRNGAPACSTDGKRIAFFSQETRGSIYQIRMADGNGSNLKAVDEFEHIGNSDWSPDGSQLVFSLDLDIYTFDLDSHELYQLTQTEWAESSPAWSPDGHKIAFESGQDGNPDRAKEIYVMSADGSNPTRLTFNEGNDMSPDWSPDSTRIVFASEKDGSDYGIYIINADGTNLTRLTNGPGRDLEPSWSPDGTRILFTSDRDGDDLEIYVMNVDGSNVQRLTDNSYNDSSPCWLIVSSKSTLTLTDTPTFTPTVPNN